MDINLENNEYLKDILNQPRAVSDTINYLIQNGHLIFKDAPLLIHSYKRIILTGMGSSYHALTPLYYRLIESGLTVHLIETSELIYYSNAYLSPDSLLIIVSQSGNSAEVVHLLNIIQNKVDVIGVVNDNNSNLAQKSRWKIVTQAGKEFSVSCKTYLASLVALAWLGDTILLNADSHFLPMIECVQWVTDYLIQWQTHVAELKTLFLETTDLFLIGRGDSLAAVGTGSLILKESAHFHAEGMSAAAFRHGPKEILSNNIQTLIFSGPEKTRSLNEQMAMELKSQGFRVELISPNARVNALRIPQGPDSCRYLVEIMPVQMISLAISLVNGHMPGVFSIGSKVTITE